MVEAPTNNGGVSVADVPNIGAITMANLQEEGRKENYSKEKVAILKPVRINFINQLFTQLSVVAGTNITLPILADVVERVGGWSLSTWAWQLIIGTVFLTSFLYVTSFILDVHRKKRRDDEVTKMLVEANKVDGPDGNFVQLIDPDPEVVNAYRSNGYKIITR